MAITCVDKRPARQSPYMDHYPVTAKERWELYDGYGDDAFLMPKGSPSKDIPSYPIVSKQTGCYHCGMMRMQLTRIGTQLNRTTNKDYRHALLNARDRLVKLALQFADRDDPSNRCNWALRRDRRSK